jgi:hypothetical protein
MQHEPYRCRVASCNGHRMSVLQKSSTVGGIAKIRTLGYGGNAGKDAGMEKTATGEGSDCADGLLTGKHGKVLLELRKGP